MYLWQQTIKKLFWNLIMHYEKKLLGVLIGITLLIFAFYFFFSSKKNPTRSSMTPELIVGTAAEFPPFEFIQKDHIVGFDIDLVNEVAHRLGKNIVLRDMPFLTLIPQVQSGALHMIAAGLTPTQERGQMLLFTEPYLESDPLVVVSLAANPKITSLDDLKGKTVIVNEGFSAERFMSQFPDIDLKRLPTVADAFLSLASKRADAFVVATNSVKPFFSQYPAHEFSLFAIPDTNEKTAFAVSKKYPELRDQIQKVLDQLKQEGLLETLKKKWNIS